MISETNPNTNQPDDAVNKAASDAEAAKLVRALIIPDAAASVSDSDGDRSPGLDRDPTITTSMVEVTENSVMRELIVPESAKPDSESQK